MNKESKKVLLSGVQPTGRVHIGNYFGAMKQFVDLQNKYDCYIFIADYHAMTTVQDKEKLNKGIIDVALDYLAIGLDPKKVILFKQSDVPQVTELTWMFNCITTVPYLMRAHAFKDREAKNEEVNAGLFDYPILMASDILMQDADIVPVGQDQKQHVEYARDTAQKFNRIYGETFTVPEPFILPNVETVPGTDGRKMSKSYGNVIPLFATDEEIKKAVMSIPTDSKGIDEPKNPDESLLFAIHKMFLKDDTLKALREKYEKGGMGYKEAKEMLIKDITDFIKPIREKREMLAKDMDTVLDILKEGGKRASLKAEKKMADVRRKVGVDIY
ncbi:MAG: tryptophan--tRNA ligase [Candidatus Pacebacteria bacterium]|nr:tryptophan--tRNA ligase [Candidatus Paceibacterota bacterium]